MLPESIAVRHVRIAAVILLMMACAAPFAVVNVRSATRPRQTRSVPAGQPMLLTTTANRDWLVVSKAPVGVSRQVVDLLLQAANLPAIPKSANLGTEARAYCNALSQLEQRSLCYTPTLARTVEGCSGYRLPLQSERQVSHLPPLAGLYHPFDHWPSAGEAELVSQGAGSDSYYVVRAPEPGEAPPGRVEPEMR